MLKALQSIAQTSLNKVGLRLTKAEQGDLVRVLKHQDINVVFDIGANVGDFAKKLRRDGYKGKIICFEPLPKAHAQLEKRVKGDPNTSVHARTAIGAEKGTTTIHVSKNSVSSSLLKMNPAHEASAPESTYIDQAETPICTLDSVIREYASKNDRVFVKADTQGYEWEVLMGAEAVMDCIAGWMLEMSLVPLYEGQHLWEDLTAKMESEGYALWKMIPGFTDTGTGRTLQFDGIFLREET